MSSAWRNRVVEQAGLAQAWHPVLRIATQGTRYIHFLWPRDIDRNLISSICPFQQIALDYDSTEHKPSLRDHIFSSMVILGGHQLFSLSFTGALTGFQQTLRRTLIIYASNGILDLRPA
ncbi:hypothetical protein BJX68DRAFT_263287 [Aspergillus pseudodeflectus]|uniref:Uncharacterized protein n=1 Tax=Aspergillus pseudodeflectus TaxID=176178 RepID=A0ABR4KWW3_9EURO